MTSQLTRRGILAAAASVLALAACGKKEDATSAPGGVGKTYTLGWTIYAGWMPWPYAAQAGIVKKWADKYGLQIKVVQINDYVESLNQFTAGKIDAVVSTNMDALTVPAAGGKDTTVLILGDYSNGNDGIVLKKGASLADLKGQSVNLVELSVSHYLLARGLEKAGLKPSDVKVVNTADADMVSAFATPQTTGMVTWNPMLSEIKKAPGAKEVFNSSQIPGEILDTLIVSTDALKADANLGKALTGIWYETLALMKAATPEGAAAREIMGKLSGTDLAGFEDQLKTTYLYYEPQAAMAAMNGPDLVTASDRVRQFSFANGLFGQGARSVDDIGIQFPNGKTLGDANNIKLRFDPTYTAMAAQGQL